MIIDRYLTRHVVARLALVTLILSVVFAAYSSAIFLSRSAAGLLRADAVALLVGLKVVIASEVVLPVALYVAVVMTFERLRRTEEGTALLAVGYGPGETQRGLLPLFIVVAAVVFLLAFEVRPRAYEALYDVRARSEAAFDIMEIEPGRFYADPDGERVILVRDLESSSEALRGVFVWIDQDDSSLLVSADRASREGADEEGQATVRLEDLDVYRLDEKGCSPKVSAGSLVSRVDFGGIAPVGYKRKAASTQYLATSERSSDIAEFQWRLSRPLSAFVLALLALRLGLMRSRRPLLRMSLAVVACVAYFMIAITARSWVKEAAVGAMPGLWWVDLTGLALLLFPWNAFGRNARRRRRAERAW